MRQSHYLLVCGYDPENLEEKVGSILACEIGWRVNGAPIQESNRGRGWVQSLVKVKEEKKTASEITEKDHEFESVIQRVMENREKASPGFPTPGSIMKMLEDAVQKNARKKLPCESPHRGVYRDIVDRDGWGSKGPGEHVPSDVSAEFYGWVLKSLELGHSGRVIEVTRRTDGSSDCDSARYRWFESQKAWVLVPPENEPMPSNRWPRVVRAVNDDAGKEWYGVASKVLNERGGVGVTKVVVTDHEDRSLAVYCLSRDGKSWLLEADSKTDTRWPRIVLKWK